MSAGSCPGRRAEGADRSGGEREPLLLSGPGEPRRRGAEMKRQMLEKIRKKSREERGEGDVAPWPPTRGQIGARKGRGKKKKGNQKEKRHASESPVLRYQCDSGPSRQKNPPKGGRNQEREGDCLCPYSASTLAAGASKLSWPQKRRRVKSRKTDKKGDRFSPMSGVRCCAGPSQKPILRNGGPLYDAHLKSATGQKKRGLDKEEAQRRNSNVRVRPGPRYEERSD